MSARCQCRTGPLRLLITGVSQRKTRRRRCGCTSRCQLRSQVVVSAATGATGDKHALTCDRLISILIIRVMRGPHYRFLMDRLVQFDNTEQKPLLSTVSIDIGLIKIQYVNTTIFRYLRKTG